MWKGRWDLPDLLAVPDGSMKEWRASTATQRLVVRQIADELEKKPYAEELVVGQRAYERFARTPAGGGYTAGEGKKKQNEKTAG